MDAASVAIGPRAWLRNPGSFLGLPNINSCSETAHTALQVPIINLPRYRFRLGAYVGSKPGRCPGWAWGGGLGPQKIKLVYNTSHTTPQVFRIYLAR